MEIYKGRRFFNKFDLFNLTAESVEANTFNGSWIWKLDILPRIVSYLWLCMHNNVPVREVLAHRGINCNSLCPICKNQNESIVHVLRECLFARHFWSNIGTSHPNLGEWI